MAPSRIALDYSISSLGYEQATVLDFFNLPGCTVILINSGQGLIFGIIVRNGRIEIDDVPEYEYWNRKGRI